MLPQIQDCCPSRVAGVECMPEPAPDRSCLVGKVPSNHLPEVLWWWGRSYYPDDRFALFQTPYLRRALETLPLTFAETRRTLLCYGSRFFVCPGQPVVRRIWLLLLELGTGLSQPNRRTRASTFLLAEIVLVWDSSSWFASKMTKEYCYEHCRGHRGKQFAEILHNTTCSSLTMCLTNLFSCRLICFAITLTEKRGNFLYKFNALALLHSFLIFLVFVAIASSTFGVRHVRQNSTRTLVIIRITYRERGKCFSPRDSSWISYREATSLLAEHNSRSHVPNVIRRSRTKLD